MLLIPIPGLTTKDSDSAAALWWGLLVFMGVSKGCGAPEPRRSIGAIMLLGTVTRGFSGSCSCPKVTLLETLGMNVGLGKFGGPGGDY